MPSYSDSNTDYQAVHSEVSRRSERLYSMASNLKLDAFQCAKVKALTADLETAIEKSLSEPNNDEYSDACSNAVAQMQSIASTATEYNLPDCQELHDISREMSTNAETARAHILRVRVKEIVSERNSQLDEREANKTALVVWGKN